MSRQAPCGPSEARKRVRVARAYLDLAAVAATSGEEEGLNVAAGNAVLAAVAASDALCCVRLGRRSRGQDHAAATQLLATLAPEGGQLARHLTAALAVKDAAHYGTVFLTESKMKSALRAATKLVEAAESAQLRS